MGATGTADSEYVMRAIIPTCMLTPRCKADDDKLMASKLDVWYKKMDERHGRLQEGSAKNPTI